MQRLRDEQLNTLRKAQIVRLNRIHATTKVFVPAFAAWLGALCRPAPPATLAQRPTLTNIPPGPLREADQEPSKSAIQLLVIFVVCTNNSDLGAVRHAEFAHNLPNMNLHGTFPQPQAACNSFI